MDHNEACNGECDYESELEEGEIKEEDEPPRTERPIHRGMAASVVELISYGQEVFEKEQVHITQSASPQKASHKRETAGTVVVQQSKYSEIHKDVVQSVVELSSFVQDTIEKEQFDIRQSTSLERGSLQGRTTGIMFVQPKCSAIHEDMAASAELLITSSQGAVEGLSTSPERGSHLGGTASTKYIASESRDVNVRQSTFHSTCGNHQRSNSRSMNISSEERHEKRKQKCFKYSDSRWVLKMIEEVCSGRFSTLLLRQTADRKKLKIAFKKQELEFFQKQVHWYKFHYAHVMPTIRYGRVKLPKLHINILQDRFHKHMKSQLIKFVKQQISERNKENQIKERWIFEAKAGYLKKLFSAISLSYSGFKLEKLGWQMTDSLDGDEDLKCFEMQSLTTQIEAIASNSEPEGTSSDVSEFIVENSPSLLEKNGATNLGFSVCVAEEMSSLDSRSSKSTNAPTMEFGEKNGAQIILAAAENEGENIERSYASQLDTSAALEPVMAVKAGKASDVSEPLPLETNRVTELGSSVGVSKEMATLEHSSQLTCAPGMDFGEKDGSQIAFSAAAQNGSGNMERPCASRSVTSAALELAMTVTTDTENDPPISKEKRRRISSGNGISEDPCCRSRRKFGEKDGTQIAFSREPQNELGNQERPSRSVQNAALELAMTVNTDLDNAPPISKDKGKCTSPGNDISEVPCSRSRIEFPHMPTSNLCRTSLRQEESPAARADLPSVNINQMMQAEDTDCEEVLSGQISHVAQVTEQPNMHSNTENVLNQYHCGSTFQADASHPYQQSGGNTHSARTGVANLGASHVHPASPNQVPTDSTTGQYLSGDGLPSDPFTIELSRLQSLQNLIAKRHQEKREQLILARQIEIAQAKKKYDELVYNSEVEVLERKRDLKIMCEKIYKQQILAEVFQVIFKASARVIPDSPRAQKMVVEPNCPSEQHNFQFPASVSARASTAMCLSRQLSVQPSIEASLRQHCVTTQHTTMDTFGRSTTTSMPNPSGGMGNGLAYHRQAPLLHSFVNTPPASVLRHGSANLEE